MAENEVTSTTPTLSPPVSPPSPPPHNCQQRGETKFEEVVDTDPSKRIGTLTYLIDNFREFTKLLPGETNKRHCETKVRICGMTFGLTIYPVKCVSKKDPKKECMCMGVIVKCENATGCDPNGDGCWSCMASVKLRVKNLRPEKDDELYEFTHNFFTSKEKSCLEWDDNEPLRFDYLGKAENGLYNEKADTLELIAEISVDAPVGVMVFPKPDVIKVNKESVSINKNQLALYSQCFHSMFYDEKWQSGEYSVEIQAPATVEHFQRMLDTMHPMNKPLDDECIEGVLHVANQFLVTFVEGKCLQFLMEKSQKTPLFKYRMADKYGYNGLKKHVQGNLKEKDFEKELFKANMLEYVQLGEEAAKAFMDCYDALFPKKTETKPTVSTPSIR